MRITLFLLFVVTFQFCSRADTIDNWQVYLNNTRIAAFNGFSVNMLIPELKNTDTLTFVYNSCFGKMSTCLLYFQDGDTIRGWNDGGIDTQSKEVALHSARDSVYWDDAYHGKGKIRIPVSSLIRRAGNREELSFYCLSKDWVERGFREVNVFDLSLKNFVKPKEE